MTASATRPTSTGRRVERQRGVAELSRRSKIGLYALLVFWTLVVVLPLYWIMTTSLKSPIQVNDGPYYIPFVDFKPNLDAWHWALGTEGGQTRRAFVNTVVVGLGAAVLTVGVGALASYGLSRLKYRPRLASVVAFIVGGAAAIVFIAFGLPWQLAGVLGMGIFAMSVATWARRFEFRLSNDDISFWLISQRILPPIAIVLPLYVFFQQLSLLDTQIALIIAYVGANVPIAIWLLRDFFATIPLDLEESAAMEGATRLQTLRKIIIPLAVPGLVATFLFILVFTWNEYLIATVLASAHAQTMPLMIVAQNATRGPQWWNMSVLILIMSTPVVVIAFFLERYIERGMLIGAIKH